MGEVWTGYETTTVRDALSDVSEPNRRSRALTALDGIERELKKRKANAKNARTERAAIVEHLYSLPSATTAWEAISGIEAGEHREGE